MFCAGLQKQDSNQSLEEAIELADPNYYPNLHAVFRVLLTMPVWSVPCDGSFSALRRPYKIQDIHAFDTNSCQISNFL
jgi:hypothetical protein